MSRGFLHALFALSLASFSACAVIVGNVRPEEEKSLSYDILTLSAGSRTWVPISNQITTRENKEPAQVGMSDLGFQSKRTGAIISISSACRSSLEPRSRTLSELTRELLLGVSGYADAKEQMIEIDNHPALQTTVSGTIDQTLFRIRTVVLVRSQCIYDLMYVSKPHSFKTEEPDFLRFVSSLKFK